ncbi:hypothetical protein ACHAQH_003043 [Verticillium albo-atrum]
MAASPPSIPTIQGLFILGGRECAIGHSSQGWLYTGMAIRMMQDIGLHLDTTGLVGLMQRWTPAETESRKRLYNSAYVWDKTLSLALGRPPSLIRRPYPEAEILDNFDDERLWRPVHATEVAQSFTPSPSWVTSTLCVFCQLHEVTTDMLLLFSRSPGADDLTLQIQDLDSRFSQWYEELPDHLKIDEPSKLYQSPPPHIVSLNLLYHTLHILLRRPLLSVANQKLHAEHVSHCIFHSKKIHAIHTLYTQTFPHRLMTYQVSYCIYTAATVEALEIKRSTMSPEEHLEAASRLTSAVKILQKEASHTPGSGKSLDTIRRLLSEGQQQQKVRGQRQQLRRRRRIRENKLQRAGATPSSEERLAGHASLQNINIDDSSWAEQERQENVDGPHGTVFTARQGPRPAPADTGRRSYATLDPTVGYTAEGGPINEDAFGEYGVAWEGDDNYGNIDTGAGFHPEAFSWGFLDDFSRMPPLPDPNFASTSM